MRHKKQKIFYITSLITVVLAVCLGVTCIEVNNSPLLYRVDAPLQDRIVRIRNLIVPQPVSPEVTLVGIDDYTDRKVGQYGKGDWLTRKPFLEQIKYFEKVFQPSVLAYDIIFLEFKSEAMKHKGKIPRKRLLSISENIRNLANGEISEIDNDVLLDVAKLTSEQGNSNLASSLANFVIDDSNATETILAFHCAWPDKDSPYAPEEWPIESMLGTDPDDLVEDNGTEYPYLRDISIPLRYVNDLPADYRFSTTATIPANILLDSGKIAFINVPRDEGGVVRRVPLVHGMEFNYTHPRTGEKIRRRFFVPSISLLSCLFHWGVDLPAMHMNGEFEIDGEPVIEVFWGEKIKIRKGSGEILEVPIDDNGSFLLDFVGRVEDFNTVSFADVGPFRAYEQATEILYNKIAMVGITSTGASDVGPCPVDDNTPFVHVHVVATSNLLTGTFIRALARKYELAILSLLALAMLPAAILFRPVKFSYYTGLILTSYLTLVFYFVLTHQYFFPIAGPLIFFLGSYFIVIIYDYLAEEKEKRKIRGMFSTMVSGDVLNFLEENPDSFSLAGQRVEATMFFSDVAGFTSISEALTPEKLVELLNKYLSPMTEIIMASNGFVDKYEGDAIMAEWGVPYPNPDHAKLACWAALDQQKLIKELSPGFKEEFGVDVTARMGLNSGSVVAGNMGSDKHFSYTVMGDPVNQAARFEPANKDYDTEIMIGESTYELARDHIESRLLDKIVVKGKTVPIQIYELIAKKGEISEDRRKIRDLYEDGLRRHWERDWEGALGCFKKALAIDSHDGASLTLIKRVEGYQITEPPEGWCGEYVRTSKD